MNSKAKYYVDKLGLSSHPEGGYFKEVYRSGEILKKDCLPARYHSGRSFSTSIYFLIEGRQFSSFHKLHSDELWHFYDGCSIKIYILTPEKQLIVKLLGREINAGEELQIVVPKLCWFAAELIDQTSFALIGCTVAPGFEFDDFEHGKKNNLISLYPEHEELINRLTH